MSDFLRVRPCCLHCVDCFQGYNTKQEHPLEQVRLHTEIIWRCRVIWELGTTAREGLVRGCCCEDVIKDILVKDSSGFVTELKVYCDKLESVAKPRAFIQWVSHPVSCEVDSTIDYLNMRILKIQLKFQEDFLATATGMCYM
ncbi:uncharacterized protein LOC134197596 [Corticium candelabrum]|uniref:uncharacterized protein LOC134197596 n=1 Tax=Corticium candelabrum TaxID=121492 RepID=UPI002E261197|nr:uncharacterized protein LOC134197596 [Corticium candelabrum]